VDVPVIGYVNAWVLAIGVVGAMLGMLFVTTLFTRKAPRKSNLPPEPFAFGTTLEQRGAHRRKGNPIGVQITDAEAKGEPFDAVIINRSAGGLCLEADRPIESGTIVSIRVINAPMTIPWIQVQIRSCRKEAGACLLGCQFVKPPPWSIMLLFG
jgi:hypothetical protein